MTQMELITDLLQRNLAFVTSTLGDFSDADMLVRPVTGANHAAWQIGHLTDVETRMVNGVSPGAGAHLPEEFAAKFKKDTTSVDDPNFFPRKAELLEAFEKSRAATLAWAKTLLPSDLDKPAPERVQRMAPTIGHMLNLIPSHVMMHVGQFQVIRRKLGKPVLF